MQTLNLQSCNVPLVSISANALFMSEIEDDHELIKALVDWAGGIPSRVAAEIGAAATTITRPYKGTATTKLGRDTINKLRLRYPDFPGWDSRNQTVRSEVAGFGDQPFTELLGTRDLPAIPLVGSAMGVTLFDPEKHIELTEIDMSDVLDHVARPASLAGDKKAYALTVVGDSMWPRFRPGRRVIVSPKAPVSIGDDVIVQLKGTSLQTAATSGDAITAVLIKELVRRSASYIELRQFNPDVVFQVPIERVANIHKVVGEVF